MKPISILILSLTVIFCQTLPRSEYEIIKEWEDYTDFQREELLSFCDFLFENGYHDRAQINLFKYLYKYPDPAFESVIYYYIARSYEEKEKHDLAIEYYSRITEKGDSTALVYQSATYRSIYVHLLNKNYDKVLLETEMSNDPYHLVFRGYAFLHTQKWNEAKKSFKGAEQQFDHKHYTKLLKPLYRSIQSIKILPKKDKTLAVGLSILPGAGQSYLKQWDEVLGIMGTTALLYLFTSDNKSKKSTFSYQSHTLIPYSNSIVNTSQGWKPSLGNRLPVTVKTESTSQSYIVPPIVIGLGVYIGSILKTFEDIDEINHQSEIDYIDGQIKKYPVSKFLDFYEPELR